VEDHPTKEDDDFIDHSDVDCDLDDIGDHRAVLNRLRRGDEELVRPTSKINRKPTLQRTDTDQRNFTYAISGSLRQYGPDSQPMVIDIDDSPPATPRLQVIDDVICPDTPRPRPNPATTTTTTTTTSSRSAPTSRYEQEATVFDDPNYHWDDVDWQSIRRSTDYIGDFQPKAAHSPVPVADTTESELKKGVVEEVSKHGSAGRFQLRNKLIALTYPQCPLDKMLVREKLEALCMKWGPSVVVSQEDHKKTDGQHLHCFIQCDNPISVRDPHFFDIQFDGATDKYTAHIEVVKCAHAYLKYITKQDKDPACTLGFNITKYCEAKENKKVTVSTKIVERVREGATVREIRNEFGGFMLLHSKQVTEFISKTHEDVKLNEAKEKWKTVLRFDGDMQINNSLTNARVAGWLNDHLLKEHQFRGENLWIKGPTKCGKTSLVQRLISLGCQVFIVNNEIEFFDGINDDTQLIVFDEFKAQKKITTMNGLCDGHNCRLNIKGGTYEVNRPIPVLILSNFTCQEAYHKSDQEHLKTLLGRFIHVEYKEGEHLAITTTLH